MKFTPLAGIETRWWRLSRPVCWMKFTPLAGIETLRLNKSLVFVFDEIRTPCGDRASLGCSCYMLIRDNALHSILTEWSLHLQTPKKDQASANRKLIFFIFYIICEMIPASVGGEQQACISGGIQSPSDIASGGLQRCTEEYVMRCMTCTSQQECQRHSWIYC